MRAVYEIRPPAWGETLAILQSVSLPDGPEAVRIAFRSNHIYLLMSGLVNLVMGAYSGAWDWGRRVRSAASVLVLAAPCVFGVAFAREPGSGSFDRPLTRAGVVILAVGVVTHAICGRRRRTDEPRTTE